MIDHLVVVKRMLDIMDNCDSISATDDDGKFHYVSCYVGNKGAWYEYGDEYNITDVNALAARLVEVSTDWSFDYDDTDDGEGEDDYE